MTRKNLNRKSLYLFGLVVLSSSVLLTAGWLAGLAIGGLWNSLLPSLSGAVGAAIGGEIGHRKGFFEANWDRLVCGGPWIGDGVFGSVAFMNGIPGPVTALLAIIGSGLGAFATKYLLRFFVNDPPLSIK